MPIVIWLIVLTLILGGLIWISLTLFRQWLDDKAKQGPITYWLSIIFIVMIGLSVAGFLGAAFTALLPWGLGGLFAGFIFALPAYFGMPWYWVPLYGLGVGLLAGFTWSHFKSILTR